MLRRVKEDKVPDLGVLIAGVLVVGSLVLLLLYLNRFTHNLRPVAVAASVARAGRDLIRRPGHDAPPCGAPASRDPASRAGPPLGPAVLVVRARRSGVIQAINVSRLTGMARQHGCHFVMTSGVGDFVPQDAPLIEVHGGARPIAAPDRLHGWVALGGERTIDQDPAFACGAWSTSPSGRCRPPSTIRPPPCRSSTTWRTCCDRWPRRRRPAWTSGHCPSGELTVPMPGWDDYVVLAITEIRQYGVDSAQVCRRLRALLEGLRDDVTAAQREAIQAQLRLLDLAVHVAWTEPAARAFALPADRQGIGIGAAGNGIAEAR